MDPDFEDIGSRGYNYCFPIHDQVVVDSLGNRLKPDIQNAFTLQNVNPLNIQVIDPGRPTIVEVIFIQ